ncbi:MAG: hypothetical protein H6935_05375 [Thiobacillus sp.]|nr:hypothetical protein [Thiobacillus sp.]
MTKLTMDEISQECAACLFFNTDIEFTDGRLRLALTCDHREKSFPSAKGCSELLLLHGSDED